MQLSIYTLTALLFAYLGNGRVVSESELQRRDPAVGLTELMGEILDRKTAPSAPSAPKASSPPATSECSNQSVGCSTGTPYCCSPDGNGGHNCQNGAVNCQQTVICCNNNFGFQLCIGNIDFNQNITINL